MRVLVVEDNVELGAEGITGLRTGGVPARVGVGPADADLKVSVNRYDCLVVDRNLPDGDGAELIERKRADGLHTPALILTARDAIADRLDGFTAGADDYLVKPFAMAELVARVRALCRRTDEIRPTVIELGDLTIDLARRRVSRDGVLLTLSVKEFAVLELLAIRATQVVSRSDLIECCWDE